MCPIANLDILEKRKNIFLLAGFEPRFSIPQPSHKADYTIVAVYMACSVCLEFDAKMMINWSGFCVD